MSPSGRASVVFGVALLVTAPTAAVFAQDVNTISAPRFELSAGYAFMRDTSNRASTGVDRINLPAGWYSSLVFNPADWFGLVGEVCVNYRNGVDVDLAEPTEEPGLTGVAVSNNVHLYTALGGARFFHKTGRVAPFAQVLVGIAHLWITSNPPPALASEGIRETDTSFAIQPGGGVTVYLTDDLGARVAVDYRAMIDSQRDDVPGHIDYANALRVIAGFTLHWGGR